jgi:signal transduction histidine kinase
VESKPGTAVLLTDHGQKWSSWWGPRESSRGHSRWRWLTVLSVLALPPVVLSVLLLSGSERGPTAAESTTWLVCNILVVLSATMVYIRFRLTGERSMGWFAAAAMSFAVNAIPLAALKVTDPMEFGFASWSGDAFDLTIVVPLVVLLLLANRQSAFIDRVDPLGLGILIGGLTGGLRVVRRVLELDSLFTISFMLAMTIWLVQLLLGLLVLVALARMPGFSRGARRRVLAVAVGLSLAYVLHPVTSAGEGLGGVLSLTLAVASSLLLTFTSLRLLGGALDAQARHIRSLEARAESAEQNMQKDEEILHELRSTIAGISAASKLLFRREPLLPAGHRRHLQRMLDAEMGRLERLLSRPAPGPVMDVDLDDVIEPAALSQAALGVVVHWEPSRTTLRARPDDIAEVVHILLSNAADHAPDARTCVRVTRGPGVVELRVRDDGPGVPAHLRHTLFERGIRNDSSRGQGIGLYVAHRLVHDNGGTLSLEDPQEGSGSCFVARFPTDQREEA